MTRGPSSRATRAAVALLVVVVAAVAGGASWIALLEARSSLVTEVQRGEQFAADERAAAFGDRVEQALDRMTKTVTEPLLADALASRDTETLRAGIAMLVPVVEVTQVTVRDAEGTVLATHPTDMPPLSSVGIGIESTGDEPMLVANGLVRDERGEVLGSLHVATPLLAVMPRLLDAPPLAEGLVSLVTTDGEILATGASEKPAASRLSSPTLLDVVRSGEAGIAEYRSDLLGADRLAAVAPVRGHDWALVIAADRDAAYAPARSLSYRLGSLIAVAVAVIVSTAAVVAVVIRRWRIALQDRHAAAEMLAATDPLTGLGNRRALDQAVADIDGQRVAVVLVDVDEFKQLNDTFGHDAGDRALQQLAIALRSSVRIDDTVVRTGGDEFLVLLPGADLALAERSADRIRATVASAGDIRVSVGAGISTTGDVAVAMLQADEALYAEKRSRRGVAGVR